MTGRYCIIVPRYPARVCTWETKYQTAHIERRYRDDLKAAWHRFHEICRSLHADGLSYAVAFNLNAGEPHVLITASGKAITKRRPARHVFTMPAPLSHEVCQRKAHEAEQFIETGKVTRKSRAFYGGQGLDWARTQELENLSRECLEAELEYWREMELLSGQREHFKPGLPDEPIYADDEVAA